MGITYGDHLIDSGYHDITPEQEREIEAAERSLCDCERGHNGIGLAGRECDCPTGTSKREPVAWRVVTNNSAPLLYLTRGEAEHSARNALTYVNGCTEAHIEPLYLGQAVQS